MIVIKFYKCMVDANLKFVQNHFKTGSLLVGAESECYCIIELH